MVGLGSGVALVEHADESLVEGSDKGRVPMVTITRLREQLRSLSPDLLMLAGLV